MSSSMAPPAVAISRGFHGDARQHAANLVHDERRQRVAFDLVGHHHQRFPALGDLLEHRQQIVHRRNLLLVDEDERILDDRAHLFRIGDEVRREVAAVESHPFDHFDRRFGAFRLLHRRRAFRADAFESVRHHLANRRVVVRGQRRHLGALCVIRHRPREFLQARDDRDQRSIEAALQIDRARARRDVPHAFGEDRGRQQRGGRRAVAHQVARPLGGLSNHLSSQVLLVIFQLEFLGDGDAVVADNRTAPFLLDEDALRPRTERHANGVSQRRRAMEDLFSGSGLNEQVFVRHGRPHLEAELSRTRAGKPSGRSAKHQSVQFACLNAGARVCTEPGGIGYASNHRRHCELPEGAQCPCARPKSHAPTFDLTVSHTRPPALRARLEHLLARHPARAELRSLASDEMTYRCVSQSVCEWTRCRMRMTLDRRTETGVSWDEKRQH